MSPLDPDMSSTAWIVLPLATPSSVLQPDNRDRILVPRVLNSRYSVLRESVVATETTGKLCVLLLYASYDGSIDFFAADYGIPGRPVSGQ